MTKALAIGGEHACGPASEFVAGEAAPKATKEMRVNDHEGQEGTGTNSVETQLQEAAKRRSHTMEQCERAVKTGDAAADLALRHYLQPYNAAQRQPVQSYIRKTGIARASCVHIDCSWESECCSGMAERK
jgi:hypothetical protein